MADNFDTGIPDITVVIRENKNTNRVVVDVPNLNVVVQKSPDYTVNVHPSSRTVYRTGSLLNVAESSLSSSWAVSSSHALIANTSSYTALAVAAGTAVSASHALIADALIMSGTLQYAALSGSVGTFGVVTASSAVISQQIIVDSGIANTNFVITGSSITGLLGVTEYALPYISTSSFSGMTVEYLARRQSGIRMGMLMGAWNPGGTITFTDISTTDVGDTSDLTIAFLEDGGYIKLQVDSAGGGSDTWSVQTLFKLFPYIN